MDAERSEESGNKASLSRITMAVGVLAGLAIGAFLGQAVGVISGPAFSSNAGAAGLPDTLDELRVANASPLRPAQDVNLEPVPSADVVHVDGRIGDALVVDNRATEQEPNVLTIAPESASAVIDQVTNPLLDLLLQDELPHANEAERGVWTDVLDGLPLDDAREILRMRKRLSPSPLSANAKAMHGVIRRNSVDGLSRLPMDDHRTSPFSGSISALQKAIAIHQHNIANAVSPAFVPGIPVTVEASDGTGVVFLREEIGVAKNDVLETGRHADVACSPGQFIGVGTEADLQLTRLGRLMEHDGLLCVDLGEHPKPVVPTVKLNDDKSLEQAITEVKLWSVESPRYLKRTGASCFQATELSGVPVSLEDDLKHGCLSAASVAIEDEEHAISVLKSRIILIREAGI